MFILLLLLNLITWTGAQKLLVVIADGLSGHDYHRFAQMPGFRVFEEEGVWSTRVKPHFPTLSLPNRHSLLTGVPPRRHGLIGPFIYNHRTGETFTNFTRQEDYSRPSWWNTEPIYITATRAGARAALFFFPECQVDWDPAPSICVPPTQDGRGLTDLPMLKKVISATQSHDLVLAYHHAVFEEVSRIGPRRAGARSSREAGRLQQVLERLSAQVRERIDLNLIVVSPHGIMDVGRRNLRVLDDHVPMELINNTIGAGAIKQILAKNGKTHQVYSQLRYHNPIPNVKVYYTTPKIGDIPPWYAFKRSATVSELVLIAEPGYAVTTRDPSKQLPPPSPRDGRVGQSGYNNELPEMSGVMLAIGPAFRRGHRRGPVELLDIYSLICALLGLEHCNHGPGRLLRLDDILTSDTRVALRAARKGEERAHLSLVISVIVGGLLWRQ